MSMRLIETVLFQLQCDWAQIQVVVLTNDGNGFGFGISGSRNSGAVVRNIFPGGAADRVGHESDAMMHVIKNVSGNIIRLRVSTITLWLA